MSSRDLRCIREVEFRRRHSRSPRYRGLLPNVWHSSVSHHPRLLFPRNSGAIIHHPDLHRTRDPSPSRRAREQSRLAQDTTESMPSQTAAPIFLGLFSFTLTTLGLIAWFVACTIRPQYYAGIDSGLGMAAVLLITAIDCYIDNMLRPQRRKDDALMTFMKGITRQEGYRQIP